MQNSYLIRQASWCQTVTPLVMPKSYPTRQASWCQTVTHMVPNVKPRDAKQLPTMLPYVNPRDSRQLLHSTSVVMPNSYPTRQASWCQTVTHMVPLGKPHDAKQLPTWCHTSSLVMPNSNTSLQASWCQTVTQLGKPPDANQLPHSASHVLPNSYPHGATRQVL